MDTIHQRNKQTDRHRATAKTVPMHSIARVKIECETKKIIGATISGQLEQPKFKTIISLDNICVCVFSSLLSNVRHLRAGRRVWAPHLPVSEANVHTNTAGLD